MASDMPGFADPGNLAALRSAASISFGASSATSSGGTITAGSPAHTKGVWVVLLASAPVAGRQLTIELSNPSSAGAYLVDIAIGAAGSEQVILSNLFYRSSNRADNICLSFPIGIPNGSTISARCQAATGSATIQVVGQLSTASMFKDIFSGAITFGAISAGNTDLTGALTNGAAANTERAWSAFPETAAREVVAASVCVASGSTGSGSAHTTLFDYAVGSGSDSAMRIENLFVAVGGVSSDCACYTPVLPLYINQGGTLFWRFQDNSSSANNYAISAVYGFYR